MESWIWLSPFLSFHSEVDNVPPTRTMRPLVRYSERRIWFSLLLRTLTHVVTAFPLQEGTYDKEKFVATLKGKGIDTVLRYTEEGRIYGTTFIDHRTGCVLNGSRMGKELSANALQEHFTLPYAGQPPISLSVPVEEPENRQGYSDSKNVMLWYIIDV